MPGVISGTCRKCKYRIDGLPADGEGMCVCPECGYRQSNPALRFSAPSLKGDIGLVIVLSSGFPMIVLYLAFGSDFYGRLAGAFWGVILSPLIGTVIGFTIGQRVSRRQSRADYVTTKGKATSLCTLAGLTTSLAEMILVIIVLALTSSANH